jgi:7-carboxy-7-deazaguanine synthase
LTACSRSAVALLLRRAPAKTGDVLLSGDAFVVSYAINELFYSLQGEGAQTGRPAVFCRFAGCNLWSGREVDRNSAICRFCDTDFRGVGGPGGGRFGDVTALADAAVALWPTNSTGAWLVCTGGEPALQLDAKLVDAFKRVGFAVALETNGTLPLPPGIDWICVSPKAGTSLHVTSGNELKVVVPQPALDLDALLKLDFEHFSVQPMDGPDLAGNTAAAARYCLDHPPWRLSQQTHKSLGLR